MVALARIAILSALVLVTGVARAHQNSVTHAQIEAEGRALRAEFKIDALDLNEAMGAPAARDISREEALRGSGRVADYVRRRFRVRNAGAPCAAGEHQARTRDRDGTFDLLVTVTYECPHALEDLALRYDLFFDVDARHQGMTTVKAFGAETQHVFREGDRELSFVHRRPLREQLIAYVNLGIEHIFQGYDHIAFLCGLLLVAGAKKPREGAREVLAIVTSFTVAHSLTLIGSALGWFRLSSRVVEPAIALSIAFVAVENLLPREPRRRWIITFGFGLVHGFGFADVLAEQGLPPRALVGSLVAFNGGVELGQLAVVLLALPVLWATARERWSPPVVLGALVALGVGFALLTRAGVDARASAVVLFLLVPALGLASRRWGYRTGVRRAGSLVLAAFGAFWFVERVTGWRLLGGALG
jgi:hypothetical protein